jgi:Icc-related predicted phosphoesterase
MNRRRFLAGLAGLTGLAMGGTAYTLFGREPGKRITVNGNDYVLERKTIRQLGEGDGKISLGVMADLHAHVSNTRFLTRHLEERVDAFLLLGDLAYRRSGNDHAKEIVSVVEPIAETGKLVLAMAGNHETKADWKKAFGHLEKYSNVIDLMKYPVAELDDLTILSLGGTNDAQRCVAGGFVREEVCPIYYQLMKCNPDKPILIATHVPKLYTTPKGLDALENGRNVGWDDLAELREHLGLGFGVSAHIHEAAGIVNPDTEESLEPWKFYEALDFNPGPVYDHVGRKLGPSSGIVEFAGQKARACFLKRVKH